MFLHIAWFEIRYWLRSWMLWIFTLIIAAMIFGAASTDHIQVGGALTNTFRNAPYVIENYYAIISLISLLMVTAFVNSAAARDFSHNTYQIVFTTPVRRRDFLLGRFFGATLVSTIPMLGVSIGILLAKYMPWVEPERWEGVIWGAHLKGILVFAVPNSFFMAAILFTIAVLARNEIISHTEEIILQNKVTDQWAYFQAKNMRLHTDELFADLAGVVASKDADGAAKLQAKAHDEAERYKDEKKELEAKGHELEQDFAVTHRKADRFDLSEVFLEVALVITSITLLSGRRIFWHLGLLIAAMGVLVAASVWMVG